MADRLTVAGFATAHVTGLTVLVLLGFHLRSTLGGILEPIGTVTGVLLFGVLWGVAIVTHHYGFGASEPWSVDDRRTAIRLFGAGFAWGALTGAGTFWVLAILGLSGLLVADPSAIVDILSFPTLLIVLLGTALSLVIGGAVGLVAAAFDLGVGDVVDRIRASRSRK